MSLIVGNEYYWLTADEYFWLTENYDGSSDLVQNFVLGPDGFYYAAVSDIDEEEDGYLLNFDIANITTYTKSTQPGTGM